MIHRRGVVLLILALGAPLVCAQATGPATAPAFTSDSLRALSDADLLKTYESAALAAGTTDAPVSYGLDYHRHDPLINAEFSRRRSAMIPLLAAALRREVTLQRPWPSDAHNPPGLVGDEIQLLQELGGPPAVAALLDVVEMKIEPKADVVADPRAVALSALEQLTFVSFHKVKPHHGNYGDAVEHPSALKLEWFTGKEYPQTAKLYRDWLAGEGKDASQWLALAQKRARTQLEGDDLDAAYCAATFPPVHWASPSGTDRDDDAARSVKRLGQILDDAKKVESGKYDYQYHGKALPVTVYNWVHLLTAYGPRARPWAKTLIRLQNETGLTNWGGLEALRSVGGKDIMAFYIDALPKVGREVEAIEKDRSTPKGFSTDDVRGWWFDAQRECRAGIDRWAGQHFASDELRLAWWKAHQEQSPEQWLREAIPIAAARAETRDAGELWLLYELFPDGPFDPRGSLAAATRPVPAGTTPEALRKQWFEQHQGELVYDPAAGCFRLPKPETRPAPK